MSLLRRLLPAPWLSVALLLLWLALSRSASPGQLVVGVILAIWIPVLTTKLRLSPLRATHPWLALRYLGRVLFDVIASNLLVGSQVVWKSHRLSPRFVVVPLDLRDPFGLGVLAIVTTIVPGTVWSELALDRSTLVLHVWDVPDEAEFIARYKSRYEQPIREMLE